MTVTVEMNTTCDLDSWSCQPSLALSSHDGETNSTASSISDCYKTFNDSPSTTAMHPKTVYTGVSEEEADEDEEDSILSSTSTTSSAVLESEIQVLFSEQMAREMQEGLDWYKMNEVESNILKRSQDRQSVVLANNSLVVDFVPVAPAKTVRSTPPPPPPPISLFTGGHVHHHENANRLVEEKNSHRGTAMEHPKQVSTMWLSIVYVAQLLYGGC